ncbi:hypothetical protein Fcan01_19011 [Folsomia candida]|uniref:Uncharacterized protein n=1 Tax=Folsomia candida TaxID=158441 RepID=A0A226DL65_FOLCA|nr:hypothetical protein Fcan01_19011 [Folsomia candida]
MTLEMTSSVDGDGEEDLLAKSIKTMVGEVLDKKLDQFLGLLLREMKKLVDKVARIEKRQDDLEEKVEMLAADIHIEFSSVREEIQEHKRIIIRMSNIVMMGVPETSAGLQVAKDIVKIIAPSFCGAIVDNRIGDSNVRKPRPLRISFHSVAEKNAALSMCKKLAGLEAYSSISVRKDLTKQEQVEWRVKVDARKVQNQEKMKTRSSLKRTIDDAENLNQRNPKQNRKESTSDKDYQTKNTVHVGSITKDGLAVKNTKEIKR